MTKHGVSFAEAATAFGDALGLLFEDRLRPERAILIGQSDAGCLLLTVHIEILDDLIRIISARRTTHGERKRYEEGL